MNDSGIQKNFNLLKMKGRFIVHKIAKIKLRRNLSYDDFLISLENNLKSFVKGTPEDPGFGFEIIKNVDFPKMITENNEYYEFSKFMIIIESTQEKYKTKIKDLIRNNFNSSHDRKVFSGYDRGYFIIKFPDLLIFKGNKEILKNIWGDFIDSIKTMIKINPDYFFDYEFFLKLFERISFKKFELEEDLRINFIESIRMEGKQGIMVEVVDVKHSYLVLESIPFLISIINNELPKICIFNFFVKDFNFTMEIHQKGSIIFKQNLGSFESISLNERAFYGAYIIWRFINFYEKWENSNKFEMYISNRFLKSMIDYLKSKGIDVFQKSIDLIKKYNKLRGEI